jgi:hypothetical protein
MGSRHGPWALLAVLASAAVVSCGAAQPGVFHPAGSIQTQAPVGVSAPVRVAPGGFRFPASVSVQVAGTAAGSPAGRAVLAGYQDYVLALWAGVLSHGKDAAYRAHLGGNALAFARREIAYFHAHHRTISGTIRYFSTTVTSVYFGTGATVTSCVDASAFRVVSTRTGAAMGPVFPRRYARYLENVAEGRRGGAWYVIHTESFPASSSEGAMCQ